MKLKVIINLCIVVMCFTLFSCSQDEEVYSCDKEVNVWVKENLSDIQQMSREDWLRLDERVNRAAYVAFTSEQKQEFWIQKFQEVLSLDWNELEKSHIEILSQKILDNPNWFLDGFSQNEAMYEEFEIFTFKWMESAEENLGWDKNLIGAIVASGNKLLDTKGKIQVNIDASVRLKNGAEKSCDCNVGINICFPKGCLDSQYSNCDKKIIGCGFALLGPCNGLCTSI
ncbi:MAG: bacteriocin fulvocin C-related protein [Bacteroidales bacterium]|jgi:hypothetical protein|nr:bacteriocin fulvocin C-related protein [Bacteroidales bacterium]